MINTCLNSIVNFQIISLKLKKTAAANTSKYTGNDERALVRCIKEYRENYFAWVYDFKLPTTNNLSERALRGVKTKMKVSGQFASSKTANYYALIRSYIETCSVTANLNCHKTAKSE